MVVDKNKLKKKLLKEFDNEIKHKCPICNQVIARYDIEDLNFEYVESKVNKNYFHSTCVKEEVKIYDNTHM